MSLISRLRAVVAGDDYLDGDFDELDYEMTDDFDAGNDSGGRYSSGLASRSSSNPFDTSRLSNNSKHFFRFKFICLQQTPKNKLSHFP